MNIRELNSYQADIASGKVERKTAFHKFGRGATISSPTTIWTAGGVYATPPETGIKLFLSSTSALDTAQKIMISGEDKHKKLQSEIIESDGTTPVSSVYDYSRTFRMSIIDGPINAAKISLKDITGTTTYAEIDFDADGEGQGQTEMCVFTVPAGHELLLDSIHSSSFSNDETNIILSTRDWKGSADIGGTNPPMVTKFHEQIYRNNATMPQNPPRKFGELVDLEARSYNDGGTGFVSVMADGVLEQLNSVPIDLENFSVSSAVGGFTASWDGQTPAETSDMKGFLVEWFDGSIKVGQELLEAKDATGISVTGLSEDINYTVTAKWVGYDNLESSVETKNVTPLPIPAPGDFPLVSALANVFEDSSSSMLYSTDSMATYDIVQIPTLSGYTMTSVATDGEKFIASGNDGNDTFTVLADSSDGQSWVARTPVAGESNKIFYVGNIWLYTDGINLSWSDTGEDGSWTNSTGIASVDEAIVKTGNYWLTLNSSLPYYSSDGKTWTASTDGSSLGEISGIAAGDGFFVMTDSTGKVAYSTDGDTFTDATSQVSGVELAIWIGGDPDGKVVISYTNDAFSSGETQYSSDGITWVSGSVPSGSVSLYYPKVVDGTWYSGTIEAGAASTGYSTSADGITWTASQTLTNSEVPSDWA